MQQNLSLIMIQTQFAQGGEVDLWLGINTFKPFPHVIHSLSNSLYLTKTPMKLHNNMKPRTIIGSLPNKNDTGYLTEEESQSF